jgi:hypothetical protein
VFITWVQLGLFAHDLWSNFPFPILVKVLLFCVHENMQCKFYLKGGTMVLASGRVVYINEFDKMWPKDLIVFLAHNISCKQFIELLMQRTLGEMDVIYHKIIYCLYWFNRLIFSNFVFSPSCWCIIQNQLDWVELIIKLCWHIKLIIN